MFICGIILIFANFLRVIFAPDPIYLDDGNLPTAEKAAQALAEVGPNEVLPLVLFVGPVPSYNQPGTSLSSHRILELPISLLHAATQNGRMVKATKFVNSITDQIFFCPTQNLQETCLAPTEFGDSEPLQCDTEPIPMTSANSSQGNCGKQNTGTLFTIFYEICPNPDQYETAEIQFYEFCYDADKRKTIYTSYIILSPYLLSSRPLYREQRVKYTIRVRNNFKPLTLVRIRDQYIQDLDTISNPKRRAYKLQFLVPDGDMAMALWRKTTYQNFNLEWQHETLIPLWDDINGYIRSYAQTQFQQRFGVRVRTAVVNFAPKDVDDVYKANVWVKIISLGRHGSAEVGGLAIFMNNFILSPVAAADPTAPLYKVDEAVRLLCQDSCIPEFRAKFEQVRGRVRCCSVTDAILEKIGIGNAEIGRALLRIPRINYRTPVA